HHVTYFLFNTPTTTMFYPLSLHDALPIFAHQAAIAAGKRQTCSRAAEGSHRDRGDCLGRIPGERSNAHQHKPGDALRSGVEDCGDRKSTRLNSSHVKISYAVFCLKKKKET